MKHITASCKFAGGCNFFVKLQIFCPCLCLIMRSNCMKGYISFYGKG